MPLNSKPNPDFSVIIPTRNRSKLLKLAISSALRQKGVSFEIIVSDNCSTDDTEKVVKGFKDKRIKYIRNKENIGYALNIKQLFWQASGDFIFTLGDDDFILEEGTLSEILKVMRKYQLGVGKIGTISYEKSPRNPYRTSILGDKLIILKPKKDKNIMLKTFEYGLGFMSGLTFNNSFIDKNKFINHPYALLPLTYDAITKYGIGYIPKYFLIAKLSINPEHLSYYLNIDKLGSYLMEDLLNLLKEFIYGKEYEEYKKKFMENLIYMQPRFKYFLGIKNYIKILQRSIYMDKSLLLNPKFILLSPLGFLPNFILKFVRDINDYYSRGKVIEMANRYNYFQKIEKLGL